MKGRAYLESSVWNRTLDGQDPERRRVTRLFLRVGSRKLRWFISAAVRAELGAAPNLDLRRRLERKMEEEHPKTLTQSRRAMRIYEDLLDRRMAASTHVIDLVHLSVALDGGMDFLVSWDVRDLANARVNRAVRDYCRANGYHDIRIGTPEQVLEWLIEGRT